MTAQRFGCLAASAVALALVGLLIGVSWTPTPQPIRTAGATAITNFQVVDRNASSFYVSVAPPPSMSLAELRCAVWRARSATCPDPTTLAQRLWPNLAQSPETLYVVLPVACLTSFAGYPLNVHYISPSPPLTLHCYSAGAWYVPPPPPRVGAQPQLILILVR